MTWSVDARVPVRLGTLADAEPGTVLLYEGDAAPPSATAECFQLAAANHGAGCACCVARSSAAIALDRLFQRRARGEIPFFRHVLAVTTTPEGDVALWTALRTDPLTTARFRPAEG